MKWTPLHDQVSHLVYLLQWKMYLHVLMTRVVSSATSATHYISVKVCDVIIVKTGDIIVKTARIRIVIVKISTSSVDGSLVISERIIVNALNFPLRLFVLVSS